MLAALHGHGKVVELLLSAGGEVNPRGWSPLIYSAFEGRTSIVRLLLEHGADRDAQAPNGMTALMAAARNGHLSVVEALLASGADLARRDLAGKTAEDIAATVGNAAIADAIHQAKRRSK